MQAVHHTFQERSEVRWRSCAACRPSTPASVAAPPPGGSISLALLPTPTFFVLLRPPHPQSAADLHAKDVAVPGLWKQRKQEIKRVEEHAGAPGESPLPACSCHSPCRAGPCTGCGARAGCSGGALTRAACPARSHLDQLAEPGDQLFSRGAGEPADRGPAAPGNGVSGTAGEPGRAQELHRSEFAAPAVACRRVAWRAPMASWRRSSAQASQLLLPNCVATALTATPSRAVPCRRSA